MPSGDVAHERILDRVRGIPEGWVRTYGDITPGAPRLAGAILRRHAGDDVPWWRVVRADGSLTQGERQAVRLRDEGVPFTPSGRVDLRAARLPEAPD